MEGKWVKITFCTPGMWYSKAYYLGSSYKVIKEVNEHIWLCETPGEANNPCAIWKKDCEILDSFPKDSDIHYATIIPISETNGIPLTLEYSVFPERNNN